MNMKKQNSYHYYLLTKVLFIQIKLHSHHSYLEKLLLNNFIAGLICCKLS